MFKEFKKFAFKGNVLDMAIGVIIGGAFGKIVTSIVNDIIMPVFGYFTAGVQFSSLKLVLSQAVVENGEVIKPEAAILYGSFIQNVVDFLIIAVSIFIFVKLINMQKKKAAEEVKEEVKAPSSEEILMEIRDILKNEKNSWIYLFCMI